MKRKVFGGFIVVLAIAALLTWAFHSFLTASDPKPSISFVGYRGSGESRVAVIRATNSSAQPFAFMGHTLTEPCHYWYHVAAGGRWHEMLPEKSPSRVAWQTLAPDSSVEFTTPLPKRENATAFALKINFVPGNGAMVQTNMVTNQIAFKDKARKDVIGIIRKGYSFIGFHSDAVDQQLASLDYRRGEWITSSLAHLK